MKMHKLLKRLFKKPMFIGVITLTVFVGLVSFASPQIQAANGYLDTVFSVNGFVASLFATRKSVEVTNSAVEPNILFASETWTGGAGDSDWSSNGNWSGVGGAGANDDLVFPQVGGFNHRNNVNNFPVNTNFNSLTFTGGEYDITGNQIFLTNGMTSNIPTGVGDAPNFHPNIILAADQTWRFEAFTTAIRGVVNLNNHDLIISTLTPAGSGVAMFGLINGTGTILKAGDGTLFIKGTANGFGTTTINKGTVQVDGTLGHVVVDNSGTLSGTGTVGAVTANQGIIAPGTGGTTTDVLTATGDVFFSAGTAYSVNLNGLTAGTEYDRFNVQADLCLCNATLTATRSFVPAVGDQFTILQTVGAGNTITGQFSQGTNIVIQGRPFSITYTSTTVVLTAQPTTRIWDGDLGIFWSFGENWDGEFLPVGNMGDSLVFPAGASQVQHHADFPVDSSFKSLSFTGNGYVIDGSGIILTGGITENSPAGIRNLLQIDVTLAQAQTFTSNGLGNVGTPNGMVYANGKTIDLNGFPLTLAGTGRQLLQGTITGAGGIIKTGAGGATLSGTNTFTGGAQINGGTLVISGTTPGTVTLNGGTIGGSGTTGPITGSGGIAPGAIPDNANPIFAILNTNGNVGLSPGSTFIEEIGGATPGTQYDRLSVTGAVNLGAGVNNLTGTLRNGFVPTGGQQFSIIQATGGVTGTFAQGNTITFGGITFNITYTANSVILTAQGPTASGVDVMGRVLTSAEGRGLRGAVVTLTDSNGLVRNVLTGPSGAYKFEQVPTGETYLISVRSRRFSFEPRILQVFDTVADFDLVALR